MSDAKKYAFETLRVTKPAAHVLHVEMNRPKKLNAMNKAMWREFRECFDRASEDPDVRVVLLSGNSKIFTAGIDIGDHSDLFAGGGGEDEEEEQGIARKAFKTRRFIGNYQESFTAIERCPKPVIAAVHSACIGAGVDMITACDIRMCTDMSYFCVKEVDIGLAADVGTLQRLPKVIGNESLVRDLCFTARKMFAAEAKSCGLVSQTFQDKKSMMQGAILMAKLIASKSPVAVQGTKLALIHARDHSVSEGLQWIRDWNASMLHTKDIPKAFMGAMTKKTPIFSKL